MNKPTKVFLSGPISSRPDTYRKDFQDAALEVEKCGDIPLNPAAMPDGLSQRDYMRISLAMLEAADIVAQLPGWAFSAGANIEHAMANKAGIPCVAINRYIASRTQEPNQEPETETGPEPAPEPEPERPVSRVERLFGKKETWGKAADEAQDGDQEIDDFNRRAVRGFIITQCENCRDTKFFCARTPITSSRCKKCGSDNPLDREYMRPAYARCKCGKEFKYMTNATSESISVNCISCGAPIDMELNKRCTAYVTPREAGGGV